MNEDLISREALLEELEASKYIVPNSINTLLNNEIDRCILAVQYAPTVEPFERIGTICNENCGYKPQDKFVEMLNDRIEKSVCKYCQMNKHCELCEIGRVFSIIALTNEEMKGGKE